MGGPVTAGIGDAAVDGDSGRGAEQLLYSSDAAMHQAKQSGGSTAVLAA